LDRASSVSASVCDEAPESQDEDARETDSAGSLLQPPFDDERGHSDSLYCGRAGLASFSGKAWHIVLTHIMSQFLELFARAKAQASTASIIAAMVFSALPSNRLFTKINVFCFVQATFPSLMRSAPALRASSLTSFVLS